MRLYSCISSARKLGYWEIMARHVSCVALLRSRLAMPLWLRSLVDFLRAHWLASQFG
jgi:hypothetical protein